MDDGPVYFTMKCKRCSLIFQYCGEEGFELNSDIDEAPNGYLRSIPDCPGCGFWDAEHVEDVR